MHDRAFNYGNHSSCTQVFLQACDRYSHKVAFSCMGQELTYKDMERLTGRFASYIQHYTDLKPGDRVVIQLPNILQFPVAIMGALRAGLVIVNTNPLYTSREMQMQFADSGAKGIIILANMAHQLEPIIDKTQLNTVIVTELADLHSMGKRWLINNAVKYIKKMVPNYHLPQAVSLRSALKKGATQPCQPVEQKLDDTALLQYTGGTTGEPKGAILAHSNLLANLMQLRGLLQEELNSDNEVIITPLPLYHIYAFVVALLMSDAGHKIVLIPNPRDIPAFIKELKKHKFSSFSGLNTLFVALCNNPQFRQLDFSHLKQTLSGGMALTHAAAERWQQVTGCPVREGYGLTETSPVVALNPMRGMRIGYVGQPIAHTQVKVVDDQGVDLAQGEVGELCVKGPQVMQGYWQDQAATDAKIKDGWFSTGDIASIDTDGFIRIIDRNKDLIIVSGFNVYPNEIDDVMSGHPDVIECAAVGIPEAEKGEYVKLFVVTDNKELSAEQLIAYAKGHLAAYKIPRHIEFRDSLPKTNVGKILRRALRDNA